MGAFTGGDNSPWVPDKEYVICNTCKDPTTAYQGIIEDKNSYNVCKKCNPETELFIDGTGCVKKLDMTSYDKKSMRDCCLADGNWTDSSCKDSNNNTINLSEL